MASSTMTNSNRLSAELVLTNFDFEKPCRISFEFHCVFCIIVRTLYHLYDSIVYMSMPNAHHTTSLDTLPFQGPQWPTKVPVSWLDVSPEAVSVRRIRSAFARSKTKLHIIDLLLFT